MPRLRQVPKSSDNPPIVARMYEVLFDDRDPVAEPGTATGTPGDWWTVFANSPDILAHAVRGFSLYQSADLKRWEAVKEFRDAPGWRGGRMTAEMTPTSKGRARYWRVEVSKP